MILVKRSTYDQITMLARGYDDESGNEHTIKLTWAWAPKLSAYDETAKCWLNDSDWRWVK